MKTDKRKTLVELNDELDVKNLSKAERKKALREWLDSLPDIPACKFCGRVVLAGVCCPEAIGYMEEKPCLNNFCPRCSGNVIDHR